MHRLGCLSRVADGQNNEWVYAQFHCLSDQGEKNQTDPEKVLRESPDLMQKDLCQAIDKGE